MTAFDRYNQKHGKHPFYAALQPASKVWFFVCWNLFKMFFYICLVIAMID